MFGNLFGSKKSDSQFEVSYFDFSEIEQLLQTSVSSSDSTYFNNSKPEELPIDKESLFNEMKNLKKVFENSDSENQKFAGFDNKDKCDKFNANLTDFFNKMGFHPKKIEKDGHILIGITMRKGFEGVDPFSFKNAEELDKARHAPSQAENLEKQNDEKEISNAHKNLMGQKAGYKLTLKSLEEKLNEVKAHEKESSIDEIQGIKDEFQMIEELIKKAKTKGILVELAIETEEKQEDLQEQQREEEQENIREFFLLEEKKNELKSIFGGELVDKFFSEERASVGEFTQHIIEEQSAQHQKDGRGA